MTDYSTFSRPLHALFVDVFIPRVERGQFVESEWGHTMCNLERWKCFTRPIELSDALLLVTGCREGFLSLYLCARIVKSAYAENGDAQHVSRRTGYWKKDHLCDRAPLVTLPPTEDMTTCSRKNLFEHTCCSPPVVTSIAI